MWYDSKELCDMGSCIECKDRVSCPVPANEGVALPPPHPPPGGSCNACILRFETNSCSIALWLSITEMACASALLPSGLGPGTFNCAIG